MGVARVALRALLRAVSWQRSAARRPGALRADAAYIVHSEGLRGRTPRAEGRRARPCRCGKTRQGTDRESGEANVICAPLRGAAGDDARRGLAPGHRFPAAHGPGTAGWWRRGDSTSVAFAAGWTMPSSAHPSGGAWTRSVLSSRDGQLDPSARPGDVPSAGL